MWITARDWLVARRNLMRRVAIGALGFLLVPLLIAEAFPALRHFIVAMLLLDVALFAAAVVALVAVARQFFGAFLSAAYGPVSGTISIGPDCVLETQGDSVAIPWQYVRAVENDPAMVFITLDNGYRHAIPRRAFATYADSLRFGWRAARYWKRAHPGLKAGARRGEIVSGWKAR